MTTRALSAQVVRVGKRTFPFVSLEAASEAYRATIDRLGLGASQTPPCLIVGDGAVVAYVSYNGKVWAGDPRNWVPGQTPIYTPHSAVA